ncbi:DUF3037 domain-containing protein [Chitinimonas arctica]|uniref:DUF3037 domain-containing protein n=1 Tax=Chitinimonas arctica TaxID=2594795 RepID=A0A516SIB9_9NEIS|nr:DUF3037 domain-containing protein [Chitinimonas arctica]QDQ27893.1 DUF3037 domain-containing protein [Chitinimonas arctica]
MTKLACRYAIVQFLPYAETGEFANVGIVLACPQSGYFGFKLQDRRYSRITRFFDELDGRVYTDSIKLLAGELKRIGAILVTHQLPDAKLIREMFSHLVHPREAILRFGQPRALLVEEPEAALQKLFARYVERDFVTPEYVEQRIERRIHTLLKGLALERPFKPHRIGDDAYSAKFPFVQFDDVHAIKIIKPFNLSQAEPQLIYEHGDAWLQKLRRLRARKLLPDQVLFAVEPPPERSGERFKAYSDIVDELRSGHVSVLVSACEQELLDFVNAPLLLQA